MTDQTDPLGTDYAEDDVPTVRFVIDPHRRGVDFYDDDTPTARLVPDPFDDLLSYPFQESPEPGDEVPTESPPSEVTAAVETSTPPAVETDSGADSGETDPAVADPDEADPDEADPGVAYPDEADPVPLDGHTIGGAAEQIVRELAPGEMDRFPVVQHRFFADEMLRRRVIRWSLNGAHRSDPLALELGGDDAELVTVLSLTMLTCAATGVLGHVGTRHHGAVTRRRRNRWAAGRQLPDGAATCLPHLSSIGVGTVAHVVEETAEDAGFTPDLARRLSILIVSALSCAVH